MYNALSNAVGFHLNWICCIFHITVMGLYLQMLAPQSYFFAILTASSFGLCYLQLGFEHALLRAVLLGGVLMVVSHIVHSWKRNQYFKCCQKAPTEPAAPAGKLAVSDDEGASCKDGAGASQSKAAVLDGGCKLTGVVTSLGAQQLRRRAPGYQREHQLRQGTLQQGKHSSQGDNSSQDRQEQHQQPGLDSDSKLHDKKLPSPQGHLPQQQHEPGAGSQGQVVGAARMGQGDAELQAALERASALVEGFRPGIMQRPPRTHAQVSQRRTGIHAPCIDTRLGEL